MPLIIPIKELKNTSNVSDLCHQSDEPIYITKNGYGDMVLMSIELFEMMEKKWSMYEDIEVSEEQLKNGIYRRCLSYSGVSCTDDKSLE